MRYIKFVGLLFYSVIMCNVSAQIHDHFQVVTSNKTDTINFDNCLKLWNDASIQQRITNGIEQHRKGNVVIKITDTEGRPLDNVKIEVEQLTHDFLFGSKFIYKDNFKSPDKNKRYEELYNAIFNSATLPIYWAQVEPEQGLFNYSKVNKTIHYKIPVDEMVDYCIKNNLVIKGHTILWERSQPSWAPEDKEKLEYLYRKRFEDLSARYAETVKYWDVVNEPLNRPIHKVLPRDCTNWSMKMADRYFNTDNRLGVNATTRNSWLNFYWEDSPYYLLIKNLQLRGTRIDFIGMQFHLWYGSDFIKGIYNGTEMTPSRIFSVLDQYSDLNLPIHISEITLPMIDHPDAENYQELLGSNFVKLFFSHPKVECITWWNLTDEFARDGKQYNGALVGEDLRVKPIYENLLNLIKEEWQTNTTLHTNPHGISEFRGFYGNYRLNIIYDGKTIEANCHVSKTGRNVFTIQMN